MSIITRPEIDAMIVMHPENSFGRRDKLSVPAGYEAVVSQDGAFNVYREGDDPELGKGFFKTRSEVYFINMQPTPVLPWGTGGIVCQGRTCGLHGSLRLRVTSSRKFLNASLGGELPLTADKLFARILERFIGALRMTVKAKASEMSLETLIRQPNCVADEVVRQMEEELEAQGLALEQLFIEEIFVADED